MSARENRVAPPHRVSQEQLLEGATGGGTSVRMSVRVSAWVGGIRVQ